ncbi:MAG: TetR/AcrR family transcriptional regulator [Pseudomonadales bacterium]
MSKPIRPATRKRRTPQEARSEILHAAEARLREHGLAGLTVVGVAGDCGMSHATVIHHFGSTAGMRQALVAHMTDRLLRDIISALQRDPAPEPPEILNDLFTALSRGGHAKLLAWLSIGEDSLSEDLEPPRHVEELFAELVPVLAARLPPARDREAVAKRMIFLVATAAIGYGIAGAGLPRMLRMDEADVAGFPQWLGRQIALLLDGRAVH